MKFSTVPKIKEGNIISLDVCFIITGHPTRGDWQYELLPPINLNFSAFRASKCDYFLPSKLLIETRSKALM